MRFSPSELADLNAAHPIKPLIEASPVDDQRISAPSQPTITVALDCARQNAIFELADLAASTWISIREAAYRGDKLTIAVHCRQVRAITTEAFAVVKALGSAQVQDDAS